MSKYAKNTDAISRLSREQFRVTQQNGTERPFDNAIGVMMSQVSTWTSFPGSHSSQARLWLHQGALSRLEEEPRVAMRGLCGGQRISEPQTAAQDQPTSSPPGGAVCLPEATRALRRTSHGNLSALKPDISAPAALLRGMRPYNSGLFRDYSLTAAETCGGKLLLTNHPLGQSNNLGTR
jgi:hypothetical protein